MPLVRRDHRVRQIRRTKTSTLCAACGTDGSIDGGVCLVCGDAHSARITIACRECRGPAIALPDLYRPLADGEVDCDACFEPAAFFVRRERCR